MAKRQYSETIIQTKDAALDGTELWGELCSVGNYV